MGLMESRKKNIAEEEEEEEEEEHVRAIHPSSDLAYEILTRVSLDCLLHRCRWVCKDWQRFIYETNFKLLHAERTQTVSGYFIQSLEISRYLNSFVSIVDNSFSQIPWLDFLPSKTVIVASSLHGLLCCVNNESHTRIPTHYIVKPTTRQWRKIPNPRTRFFTKSMAMVVKQSCPKLHYKIVRFSRPKINIWNHHCEIFDSNNWAWKRLEDIKFPFGVLLDLKHGILVNESFHWLTSDDRIFVFNVDQENWTTIELPREQSKANDDFDVCKTLVDYEGKIAVFYSVNWELELWVLEEEDDCGNHTWKKKYCINLGSLHRNNVYSRISDMYSRDIVLMTEIYGNIMLYNCNNDTYTTRKLPQISFVDQVYPFQSDLSPCSLR